MKNSYIHMLKTTLYYAKDQRKRFVLAYCMFFIANLFYMLSPIWLAMFLNKLQEGGEDVIANSLPYLIAYSSMPFFFWLFHGYARVIEREVAFHIEKNYIEEMLRKVLELPLRWHRDNHSGETYDKIYKGWTALFRFASDGFQNIETLIRMVGSFIAVLYFLPIYGLGALVFGVIIFMAMSRFDRILVQHRKQINKNDHTVSSAMFDYVSNITTVITLRFEELARKEVVKRLMRIFPVYQKNIRMNEWKWFTISMLVGVMSFSIILVYLYKNVSTSTALQIGTIVALIEYLVRFTDAFFNVAWQYEDIIWHSTDVQAADPIVSAHSQLTTSKTHCSNANDWKNIEIKNLWFSYEDSKKHTHHVDNISLSIERGKRIAFVGESGSGKSTLMILLRGLEVPNSVQLCLDDTCAEDLGMLSDITTLMPQDPEIFENTIEYNISAGLEHSTEEIEEACRIAKFDSVLPRLPDGLQSNIKEKGVNLSGGEKQRLALARGVFAAKHSSLILMDEPTSSVDPTNEMIIYQNMFDRFKNQAVISSIHRLHLLPLFDLIYVLDTGKIVQSGTFDELVGVNGRLRTMWEEYSKHMSDGNYIK